MTIPLGEKDALANRENAAKILRGWAAAYRRSPEHRFPSGPHAEFFPFDLEHAAALLVPSDSALTPAAPEGEGPVAWRSNIEDVPLDGSVVIVRAETPFRWRSYSVKSEQFRKGIKGRWQRMNEFGGWDNCEHPVGDWKAHDTAEGLPR